MGKASSSRPLLEAELSNRIHGKLISFLYPGSSHIPSSHITGYCDEVAIWPNKDDPTELDVIVQVNGNRYTVSHDFFNQTLQVL